jgi:hypothetical protein
MRFLAQYYKGGLQGGRWAEKQFDQDRRRWQVCNSITLHARRIWRSADDDDGCLFEDGEAKIEIETETETETETQ